MGLCGVVDPEVLAKVLHCALEKDVQALQVLHSLLAGVDLVLERLDDCLVLFEGGLVETLLLLLQLLVLKMGRRSDADRCKGGHRSCQNKHSCNHAPAHYAAGGSGDKKLIYRTDIINQYPPYPVFEGEKYVALSYKYRLIDQTWKLAVLDEVVCNVEYQPDGSSGTMWKQYLKNPRGFAFWRKVCMQYPYSTKRLVIDCIHYCTSSILAKNRNYIKESPRKLLTLACTPFGCVLAQVAKRKAKQ